MYRHEKSRSVTTESVPEPKTVQSQSWKGGHAYVFTTGWGEPVFPDTPSSLMPKLIAAHNKQNPRAPLPHARLHDLRHIHATKLLLAGVPPLLQPASGDDSEPLVIKKLPGQYREPTWGIEPVNGRVRVAAGGHRVRTALRTRPGLLIRYARGLPEPAR